MTALFHLTQGSPLPEMSFPEKGTHFVTHKKCSHRVSELLRGWIVVPSSPLTHLSKKHFQMILAEFIWQQVLETPTVHSSARPDADVIETMKPITGVP